MKIGPLQLSDIPPEINERFFGYVQLMPDLEDLVAEAENTTHYGFGSLRKPAIRSLRKTVQDHLDLFMQELGYRKAGGDPDEKAKRILEEAREDLDDILSNMGVPGFGTGRQTEPGISVSVKGLQFPDDSNYVSLGTELADFWYSIRNTTLKPKVIDVEVFTHERDIGKIETILEATRHTIPPEKEFSTTKIWVRFKSGVYPKGRKIGVTARVSDENGNRLAQKTFFVYLEMEPETEEEFGLVELRAVDWPRLNSRRVDYDQSLSNLVYELENRTPLNMRARLKIRTLTSEREPIDNVSDSDMELGPMESKELAIGKVTMSRVKYQDVRRGKMILRCHAVALETTKKWEKGFRLAEHNISFYLNMDPSYGFFEDPVYFDGGPLQPRSEAQPVQGSAGIRLWTIRINKTHPAYISAQADEIRQKNYLFEEMARQTVYVLLRKGQFDPIRKLIDLQAIDAIDKMEPEDVLQSVAYRVTDRIVAEYYRS
jgi:hypothetical protein